MLENDGRPSCLKTGRRDEETEREGEKERTIYRAQLRSNVSESRPARLRKATGLRLGTRAPRHYASSQFPFLFLALPRNERVSNGRFARTSFPLIDGNQMVAVDRRP